MTPTKVLDGCTPYEKLFGTKPPYETLRVFGSLCYVHMHDRDKDKLGERSRRCVFVGNPFGKKAWKVYDLDNNKFLVSKDVNFSEEVFPHNQNDVGPMEQAKPTRGPDDDWIIYIKGDKGNMTQTPIETQPEESSSSATNEVDIGVDQTNTGSGELVNKETTESEKEVTPEPEMGRGCREKIPSIKLRDYVSYNACRLEDKSPHHDLKSESSPTVSGSTPYPLENYISDERFSPAHKVFLAATTSDRGPKSYKEAFLQKIWRESMQKEIAAFEKK